MVPSTTSRKVEMFCLAASLDKDDVFIKTQIGNVPATSVDLSASDVVDFYDNNGLHIGFVDGGHIEFRNLRARTTAPLFRRLLRSFARAKQSSQRKLS
jgi:hypothetical protein